MSEFEFLFHFISFFSNIQSFSLHYSDLFCLILRANICFWDYVFQFEIVVKTFKFSEFFYDNCFVSIFKGCL